MKISQQLEQFAKSNGFKGKGALSVALHVTRQAKKMGLPLNPAELLADKGTQVRGLGMATVQAILKDHGIERILSREAGRTSRGSVRNMEVYVAFLNQLPGKADLNAAEYFWIGAVQKHFAAKPFKFRIDASLSLRAAVRDILQQAKERQTETPGQRLEGAMLQHLVGAKLDLVLGPGAVEHHPVSEADQADGRAGDFTPGDVAIHVTTHPTEALIGRCVGNLHAGLRPIIVTLSSKAAGTDMLADTAGVAHRVEVIDIEQFLAANLHERALFQKENHRPRVEQLIARYNELVEAYENDPSLRIELAG